MNKPLVAFAAAVLLTAGCAQPAPADADAAAVDNPFEKWDAQSSRGDGIGRNERGDRGGKGGGSHGGGGHGGSGGGHR
jgi:hypothetical protein